MQLLALTLQLRVTRNGLTKIHTAKANPFRASHFTKAQTFQPPFRRSLQPPPKYQDHVTRSLKASMTPLMEKQHDSEASATLHRATTAENAKTSGTTRLFEPNVDLIERFARQGVNTRSFVYFASENDCCAYVDIRLFLGWNFYCLQ